MRYLNFFFLILLVTLSASAQKLPNKQETSVRATSNIKIDSKATEWQNQFQAYNHATDVFYSIANDDENLYLITKAADPTIILRILSGGISFSITPVNKNKTSDHTVVLTYPIIENMPPLNYTRKKNVIEDTSKKTLDSIMILNNLRLGKSCKTIKVKGISTLDTLISVYNEDGIQAAGLFDNHKSYVCEIAIKLNLLKLSTNGLTKFSYQIRVNGTKPQGEIKALSVVPGHEDAMASALASLNQFAGRNSAPTDFSGEYTLAKAP